MNMIKSWSLLATCAILLATATATATATASTLAASPRVAAADSVEQPPTSGSDEGEIPQHNPWG